VKDIIGPHGSGPDEEQPSAAADLRIVLVPCAFALPRPGRKRKRGWRWRAAWMRAAWTAVALEQTRGSAASAFAGVPAYEAPSPAAELRIVLVPCTLSLPRYARERRHGSRTRPLTRPPGAGPPLTSRHLGGAAGQDAL
jgi:hypothetical protein